MMEATSALSVLLKRFDWELAAAGGGADDHGRHHPHQGGHAVQDESAATVRDENLRGRFKAETRARVSFNRTAVT